MISRQESGRTRYAQAARGFGDRSDQAGAAMVHLHVRDPETGKPSIDSRIRDSGVDTIINLTTGEGGMLEVNDRRFSNTLINEDITSYRCKFSQSRL